MHYHVHMWMISINYVQRWKAIWLHKMKNIVPNQYPSDLAIPANGGQSSSKYWQFAYSSTESTSATHPIERLQIDNNFNTKHRIKPNKLCCQTDSKEGNSYLRNILTDDLLDNWIGLLNSQYTAEATLPIWVALHSHTHAQESTNWHGNSLNLWIEPKPALFCQNTLTHTHFSSIFRLCDFWFVCALTTCCLISSSAPTETFTLSTIYIPAWLSVCPTAAW